LITEEELTHLLDRLLEVGVPPTAIAKAWSIDPFLVRDRMNDLRISRYGDAELSEALAGLQWDMLEEFRSLVHDAPYTDRAKFIMGMVSKTMSLTARQNPETLGTMRADLLGLFSEMTGSEDVDELADQDTEAFVAVTAADDDQDEVPDH
jgi:hypothetical protein